MAHLDPMNTALETSGNGLPTGTELEDGEYRLLNVIGEGGFGVVYRALDLSLGREVAIKEYMPVTLAGRKPDSLQVQVRAQRQSAFDAGLRGFINEARLLAKFSDPALVHVYRFFEANGTAYMVMRYYEGQTLKAYLDERAGRLNQRQLMQVLTPILNALKMLHEHECYHRDIAPDNILLTRNEGPVLLDFGAARRIISGRTQALTMVLKPGFAPIEQYVDDNTMPQGAWTDIYQLGAVMYVAITGQTPTASVSRMVSDPIKLLSPADHPGYSTGFLQGVLRALAVKGEDRPQTIVALMAELHREAPPPQPVMDQAAKPPITEADERKPPASPGRLRRLALTAAISAGVLSLGVWGYGAYQDQQAWKQASQMATVAGYERYIKAFPTGRHRPEALDRQAELLVRDEQLWAQAQKLDSIAAYEAYLKEFAQGKHVVEVRTQLDFLRKDEYEWLVAKERNTPEGYEAYLQTFSQKGKYREEAQKRIEALGPPVPVQDEPPPQLPEDLLKERVREETKADKQAWEAARSQGTISGFDAYLKAYPKGQYRRAAHAQILNLRVDEAAKSKQPRAPAIVPSERAAKPEVTPPPALHSAEVNAPAPPQKPPSQAASNAVVAVAPAAPMAELSPIEKLKRFLGVGPKPRPMVQPSPAPASPKIAEQVVTPPPPTPPKPEPEPVVPPPPAVNSTRGRLVLNIKPWGQVFIDGVHRGNSPPLKELELTYGWHKVLIINPQVNRSRLLMKVEIKRGQQDKLVEHRFE